MALHDIEGTVTVHTFAEGAELFQRILDFFCRERTYDLRFNIIKPEQGIIYEDKALTVETFPLYHRVPCTGFIFREKPKLRHINREMVDFYRVPVSQMLAIQEGVDTIYHEATYADDQADKAAQRGHSTAAEAARIALEAGARQLIIGHYSKSYNDESRHLAEARAIFPNTIAATEGMTVDLN